jgi:hypothetical protein
MQSAEMRHCKYPSDALDFPRYRCILVQRQMRPGPCGRRDLQRQNDRKPARCRRISVSGWMIASASTILGTRRYSPTNTNRSTLLKTTRFGHLRRSTLTCCRRTRISASSRALERNKQASTDHSSVRTLTIGYEHHPIRAARQSYRVFDKDNAGVPNHDRPAMLIRHGWSAGRRHRR